MIPVGKHQRIEVLIPEDEGVDELKLESWWDVVVHIAPGDEEFAFQVGVKSWSHSRAEIALPWRSPRWLAGACPVELGFQWAGERK